MNVRVCEDYPCSTCVLDCEFCFALMAGDATDGTGQVVTMQRLHIFDLERVQI